MMRMYFFRQYSRPKVRAILGAGLLGCVLILAWPPPLQLLRHRSQLAVQIEDRNGKALYEVRNDESGSYHYVPLTAIPPHLINAFLSIEDRNFWVHPGFDVVAITRAALQNLQEGRVISGASTVTQQLVRMRLQPQRRTVLYKMKEALYAWKLEQYLSKQQILESYLNGVYIGHQAYGVHAAAHTLFRKSLPELSLAESALIAGLIQSPSAYDPFRFPEEAKKRQERVLAAMLSNAVITQQQYEDALHESLTYARGRVSIRAPHFVQWLRQVRPEQFTTDKKLRTTLDLNLQTEIERIVERKLTELKDKNVTAAAVVVLSVKTGDILAMVGSADYFDEEHDGAVNVAVSARQPGSTIKPFTYALALAAGDTAVTTVADIETQFFTQEGNPYIPRNYDYGYHGLVRYREALANSYNIAAVLVLEKVGVSRLMQFLRSAGISTLTQTPEHYGLALTLGDAEVTLLDLTSAYAMFARGGNTLTPRVLPTDPIAPGEHILDARVAWLITDILSDDTARLPEFGIDSPLTIDRPMAAKTGTTRNSRDNWTIGYTPDIAVGVWVGNADNSPMRETSGVTGAGPIFHDVMLAAHRGIPVHDFEQPTGLERTEVCALSGKLPTPQCPHTIQEWFIKGSQPVEHDDLYRAVHIDTRNGLLASDTCNQDVLQQRVFAQFPKELATWARENGWPQPPDAFSPLCSGQPDSVQQWLRIEIPHQNDSFKLDPLIPDTDEQVIFEAQARGVGTVEWYINGKKVGEGKGASYRFDWQPSIGRFTVEAKAGKMSDKRSFEVIR